MLIVYFAFSKFIAHTERLFSAFFAKSGAKVQQKIGMCKFLGKKSIYICVYAKKAVSLRTNYDTTGIIGY